MIFSRDISFKVENDVSITGEWHLHPTRRKRGETLLRRGAQCPHRHKTGNPSNGPTANVSSRARAQTAIAGNVSPERKSLVCKTIWQHNEAFSAGGKA